MDDEEKFARVKAFYAAAPDWREVREPEPYQPAYGEGTEWVSRSFPGTVYTCVLGKPDASGFTVWLNQKNGNYFLARADDWDWS